MHAKFILFSFIAGVHDSYWTHACDVDELNRILREKFVELYETPILENVILRFMTNPFVIIRHILSIIFIIFSM